MEKLYLSCIIPPTFSFRSRAVVLRMHTRICFFSKLANLNSTAGWSTGCDMHRTLRVALAVAITFFCGRSQCRVYDLLLYCCRKHGIVFISLLCLTRVAHFLLP